MDKYDYEDFVIKIKLLELKLKRIALEKEYHATQKEYEFSFQDKEKWNEKYNFLLEEEETTFEHLYTVYEEFAQIMYLKRKQ